MYNVTGTYLATAELQSALMCQWEAKHGIPEGVGVAAPFFSLRSVFSESGIVSTMAINHKIKAAWRWNELGGLLGSHIETNYQKCCMVQFITSGASLSPHAW